MFGELSINQIETLLRSNIVGRLACTEDDTPYIVPTIYVFDGNFIYAHSREGLKLDMMRKNPNVSFQVDEIRDFRNWQSVVVQGKFEEVEGREMGEAIEIMRRRLLPYNISSHTLPAFETQMSSHSTVVGKSVVFRIIIEKSSGRFEKSD